MSKRFQSTKQLINNDASYDEIFNRKMISSIKQYTTISFKEINDLNYKIIYHTTKPFETLQKISFIYYNTTDYWWAIAATNKIGDVFSLAPDQELKIYFPIEKLLRNLVK